MTSDLVLCARDGSIAEVTLNRPEVMNALSFDLRTELTATFRNLANDRSCEIVILTGAGRAFTAGLDLKELGGETSSGNKTTDTSVIDLSDAVGLLKVPLIGAINGFAITGGFELALMCDILIASTEALFADTHARVGVVPGWGLSQRLPRLVGINRAKELSLSGNFLDAQTAYNWGLVNRVVDPDDLLPSARASPGYSQYRPSDARSDARHYGQRLEHDPRRGTRLRSSRERIPFHEPRKIGENRSTTPRNSTPRSIAGLKFRFNRIATC